MKEIQDIRAQFESVQCDIVELYQYAKEYKEDSSKYISSLLSSSISNKDKDFLITNHMICRDEVISLFYEHRDRILKRK